jgi:hypothetical protein
LPPQNAKDSNLSWCYGLRFTPLESPAIYGGDDKNK